VQHNTVNEYTLIQQSSVLFQENYQRNQNEQKLYMNGNMLSVDGVPLTLHEKLQTVKLAN
jgi:hypothetical protein